MGVCTPYSATQYYEYVYKSLTSSNCQSSTCGSAYSQNITVSTRKAFYEVDYALNIKLYKNPQHKLTISALNTINTT